MASNAPSKQFFIGRIVNVYGPPIWIPPPKRSHVLPALIRTSYVSRGLGHNHRLCLHLSGGLEDLLKSTRKQLWYAIKSGHLNSLDAHVGHPITCEHPWTITATNEQGKNLTFLSILFSTCVQSYMDGIDIICLEFIDAWCSNCGLGSAHLFRSWQCLHGWAGSCIRDGKPENKYWHYFYNIVLACSDQLFNRSTAMQIQKELPTQRMGFVKEKCAVGVWGNLVFVVKAK